jgi:putative DNA primase/helicase
MGERMSPHGKVLPAGIFDLNQRLAKTEDGGVQPSLSNAILILSMDPTFDGMFGHDDFADAPLILRSPPGAEPDDPPLPGPYPRVWGNADTVLVQAYIQRTYADRMAKLSVEDAMATEAGRHRFHPVRDWLAGLRWDGTARLDTWLVAAFGAPKGCAYHAAVGAKMLIAAVRRVRRPGVKFDHMPVAQGAQGLGKSTVFRALFSDAWFSDAMPPDLSEREAAMALHGVWGLEMGELTQLIASEPEAVKAFLSRAVDRYRPPYGRTFIEKPRQGILVGSTNSQEWLRDATGNRRFWPIRCEHADAEWVATNRVQLWAEAAAREASGEAHWLDDVDVQVTAAEEQDARMLDDPWMRPISRYVELLPRITAPELLSGAIEMPKPQQNRAAQMRVTAILTRLGWVAKRSKEGRWWVPPR